MHAPAPAGTCMYLVVASNIRESVIMQVKRARGGEAREAAALFAETRDRVDRVEVCPLGGLQRRLQEEVAEHAAAYSIIASLESEAVENAEDENLAEGVEVRTSRTGFCPLLLSLT